MSPQIHVDDRARESLRLMKALSGARNYSEVVLDLMEEAGYEPPEGELSDEELVALVFSGD